MATPNLFGLKAALKEDNTRDAPPTGEAGGAPLCLPQRPLLRCQRNKKRRKKSRGKRNKKAHLRHCTVAGKTWSQVLIL